MKQKQPVSGFSKLTSAEKRDWLRNEDMLSPAGLQVLEKHLHPDPQFRELYQRFSENTVSEFHLPYGLAPNFRINGELFTVPMVVEESSVVAASAHAARFWAGHGGFQCQVEQSLKTGQVHFRWSGEKAQLESLFREHHKDLLSSVEDLTRSMENRGGGIASMDLLSTEAGSGLYQLFLKFRTSDAMGANFINSVLEGVADRWEAIAADRGHGKELQVIMAILSNHTPECLASCRVEAPVEALEELGTGMPASLFAEKFVQAVEIARMDPYRAVTHNKGIMNGVDAVVMATGNDFRAVEAAAHAHACREGSYRGLSTATLEDGLFRFELEIPLALGTVGGLTRAHPLAAASLEILGHPDATRLMMITAAAGLANNFSAVRSLVSTGIQKGHMKLHLDNILMGLRTSADEKRAVLAHFQGKTISHSGVRSYLEEIRKEKLK